MTNSRADALIDETVRLRMRFTYAGELYDPEAIQDINIYQTDPATNPEAVPIATLTPTKESTGIWYVDHLFTASGTYFDTWAYIPDFNEPTIYVTERVIVAASLEAVPTQDWKQLSTWEDELQLIRDRIAEVTKKLIVSDGSLHLDYQRTYAMLRSREQEVKLEIIRQHLVRDQGPTSLATKRDGWDE